MQVWTQMPNGLVISPLSVAQPKVACNKKERGRALGGAAGDRKRSNRARVSGATALAGRCMRGPHPGEARMSAHSPSLTVPPGVARACRVQSERAGWSRASDGGRKVRAPQGEGAG